jgi:hypothetical protein
LCAEVGFAQSFRLGQDRRSRQDAAARIMSSNGNIVDSLRLVVIGGHRLL